MTKISTLSHHQICFVKLKMHQNPFWRSAPDPAGELTTLPQTP